MGSSPEQLGYVLLSATQQENLQLLSLRRFDVTRQAFQSIGAVRHLRFLACKECSILANSEIRMNSPMTAIPKKLKHHLTGTDIAELPNLGQLDTLVIRRVKDCGPLLSKLEHCNLRALYIAEERELLSMSEVAQIKKIRTLETLSVHNIQDGDLWLELAEFAELPNLKQLYIDYTPYSKVSHPPVRFPRLQRLVIGTQRSDIPLNKAQMDVRFQTLAADLKASLPSNFDSAKFSYVNWSDLESYENDYQDWFSPYKFRYKRLN
jgi:hypothetical protein